LNIIISTRIDLYSILPRFR